MRCGLRLHFGNGPRREPGRIASQNIIFRNHPYFTLGQSVEEAVF